MNKKVVVAITVFILIIIAMIYFYILKNDNNIDNKENRLLENISTNEMDSEIEIRNQVQDIIENSIQINNKILNEMLTDENEEIGDNMKINIKINEKELTATLIDNSSSRALIEKLKENEITIDMHDYSNFEKVGNLGFSLPRNDTQISTDYGDLILYQGNQFVIYYDKNNWNFTRLGKIDDISQENLKEILGSGNVTISISL